MREDWSGRHFIYFALVVTGLSVIFFFAGQQIFSKIGQGLEQTKRWVKDSGGTTVQIVDFHLVDEAGQSLPYIPLKLQPMVEEARQELMELQGKSFFALSLSEVQERLLKKGWIQEVSLSRNFSGVLRIQAVPKKPQLLVRSKNGWALFDQSGFVLEFSNKLPGSWVGLPRVYGLESFFDSAVTVQDLNREFEPYREMLSDLYNFTDRIQKQIRIEIDRIQLKMDPWSQRYQYEVFWRTGEKQRLAVFQSLDWKSRMTSFQYILSDLQAEEKNLKILGQYPDRWFVQQREGGFDG